MQKIIGLIGNPLSHSFSPKYFKNKFEKENIGHIVYQLFEMTTLDALDNWIINTPNLLGFNVTIPFKKDIIPYLNRIDPLAKQIGAVNTVKIEKENQRIGFNTDYWGFKISLKQWLPKSHSFKALILGTGGAAQAVAQVLKDLNIDYRFVSRISQKNHISYNELKQNNIIKNHLLIINTTPLGMYPHIEQFPPIDFTQICSDHYCYDLVYRPEETAFMKRCSNFGAHVKNGYEMLVLQAEASWKIWNK